MSDAPTQLREAVIRLERAKRERDQAIRAADAEGMEHREIAAITGLNNQQVHKIIKAPTASDA